jgi:predicted transcriptional regulator
MSTSPAKAKLDPATVFAALSHPTRLRLIVIMADGRMLSASQAALAVGRQLDGVIKHLHTLRDSGLVQSKYKEDDRRSQLFYIPEVWRTEPEVLDFGFCILDLSATQR